MEGNAQFVLFVQELFKNNYKTNNYQSTFPHGATKNA